VFLDGINIFNMTGNYQNCSPAVYGSWHTIEMNVSINQTVSFVGAIGTVMYVGNLDTSVDVGYHEFRNLNISTYVNERRVRGVDFAKLGYYVADDPTWCHSNLLLYLNGYLIDSVACDEVINHTDLNLSSYSYMEVEVPVEYLQDTNIVYFTLSSDIIFPEYWIPFDNSTIDLYNESYYVANGVIVKSSGEHIVDFKLWYDEVYDYPIYYEFYAGWNLFNMPISPENNSIRSVLQPIEGKYGKVLRFNKTYNTYETFNPAYPEWLNNFTIFDTEHGYWISITENCTLDTLGYSDIYWKDRNLKQGWNMVSWESIESGRNASIELDSIFGSYGKILRYNTTASRYETFNPSYPPFLNDFTEMTPGKGYWISMIENKTWRYLP